MVSELKLLNKLKKKVSISLEETATLPLLLLQSERKRFEQFV